MSIKSLCNIYFSCERWKDLIFLLIINFFLYANIGVVSAWEAAIHAEIHNQEHNAQMHRGHQGLVCTAAILSALCGFSRDGDLATPVASHGFRDDADGPQIGNASPYLAGYAPIEHAVEPDSSRDFRFVGRFRSEYVHYEADSFSGGIWSHEAGIDYIWNEQLLIGVIGRYDTGEADVVATNGTFLGEGVTLGLRGGTLLGYGMTLDGTISYTWLEYESVAGLLSGATQARRTDASINLAGAYALSETLSVEPNLRYSYTREQQDAYTLALGTAVASSTTSAGAIGAGTLLRYTSELSDGAFWSIYASAHADYDFALTKGLSSTPYQSLDDVWSARFGLGGYGSFANGITVYLEGEVDRLGVEDYTRYTGTARLSIPLN